MRHVSIMTPYYDWFPLQLPLAERQRERRRIAVIKAYYYYGFASNLGQNLRAHKVTSFVRAKPLAKS